MKRVDGSLRGADAIRESLEALIGAVPMKILGYSPETYEALLKMTNNQLENTRLEEGVTSGLKPLL